MPITYVRDGKTRQITIPKIIDAQIEAVPGANKDENLVVTNSQYWMGPNITVARGGKSRVKDYGRVWRFDGLSAEMVDIDWKGPGR